MNAETNLLSAIYQNADMGCSSIEKIIPKIADNELRSEVTSQLRRYRRSYNRVCSELHAERTEPKKLNPFTKAMSDIGLAVSCAADSSTSNIAKMLIQGTNMGIIRLNKSLNAADAVSESARTEAVDMLNAEQAAIDTLKP
mgnify:FL=1